MLDFVKKLFGLEPKKKEPWPFPTSRPQEPIVDAVDMTPTLTEKVEEPAKVEKKAKKTTKPKIAKVATDAVKKPRAKKAK
jgi:hypothetical protein